MNKNVMNEETYLLLSFFCNSFRSDYHDHFFPFTLFFFPELIESIRFCARTLALLDGSDDGDVDTRITSKVGGVIEGGKLEPCGDWHSFSND